MAPGLGQRLLRQRRLLPGGDQKPVLEGFGQYLQKNKDDQADDNLIDHVNGKARHELRDERVNAVFVHPRRQAGGDAVADVHPAQKPGDDAAERAADQREDDHRQPQPRQLVEAARSRASDFGNDNSFQFMQGDALQLPFDDGTFDLVVSQTFLINIPDYRGALQEMKRVCRPGGLVASCTAARIPAVEEAGQYPAFYRNWKPVYDRLFRKAWDMYGKLSPISGRMSGVSPTKVQRIFVDAGLIDVTTYPIGGFFSLSNPTISDEEKKRYLELDYLAETKKLRKWFETVPEAKEYFTEDEVREFEAAAAAKRDALTAAVGENRIWEWQAITMLLVLGTNTGRQSAGW